MEANEQEKTPLSKLYTVEKRSQGERDEYVMRRPFGAELRAVITGEDTKTLTFTKLLRGSNSESAEAALIMLKGMIITAQNGLAENEQLEFVELPMGERDLQHLFSIPGMGEIFGAEEIAAGKELYNPRPEETPKRRAEERPSAVRLTLYEITERLKEYEERHGDIRQ